MTVHELQRPIRGTAAGVPYVAQPPADGAETAPLVVVWHLASPPRSEAAMAAALPLRGIEAEELGTRLTEALDFLLAHVRAPVDVAA